MSITGDEASSPLRVGYPVCDTIGGLTAAFAVVAALLRARATGRGASLDVSMLDATLATMGWVVSNYLNAGIAPLPMGNDNFTAAPSGTFRTGDGLINIAANEERQFAALARDVGAPEWLADPRFASREARKRHRAEINAALEAKLAARPAAEWESGSSRPGCRWAGCCLCRRFSAATTRGRRSSSAAGTMSPVRRGRWPWRGRAFALTASGRRRRTAAGLRGAARWAARGTGIRRRRARRAARVGRGYRRPVLIGDACGPAIPLAARPARESGCTVPGGRRPRVGA